MDTIITIYNQVTTDMKPTRRAYLELHLAILFFGFSAILGKWIQLDAILLVWWRVLLTSISLMFVVKFWRLFRDLPRSLILKFCGIGVIVALHWITFFGAIHLANASIALVCLATGSFFTALLEPLIMKQKVKGFEILLSLSIIPGILLIVDSTEVNMQLGLGIGLLSAIFASLFGILNKKFIHTTDSINITFIELGSCWIFLSLIIPFYLYFSESEIQLIPSWEDFYYLLILAIVCTTGGYVLALRALKHISAFAANLTVNLEPVYGIILAIILLQENQELSPNFYWGVLIILGSVFSYPFFKKKFKN